MFNQIINNAVPIVVTAILAVATVIIKGISDVTCEYIKAKKEQLISKIGAEKYNTYRDIAFDVYYRVQQEFKGQNNVADEKLKRFNKYLSEKIPGLTYADLNHFRECVVGTVNEEIKANKLLDKVDILKNPSENVEIEHPENTEINKAPETSLKTPEEALTAIKGIVEQMNGPNV